MNDSSSLSAIPERIRTTQVLTSLQNIQRAQQEYDQATKADNSGERVSAAIIGGLVGAVLAGVGLAVLTPTRDYQNNLSYMPVVALLGAVVGGCIGVIIENARFTIQQAGSIQQAANRVTAAIQEAETLFPDLVKEWGGADVLKEPAVVKDVIATLAREQAAESPVGAQPHRGSVVLGLGLAGLLLPLLAPIAWIMGNNDLAAMDESKMDNSGRENTASGRMLGMVATLGYGLLILIALSSRS